MNLHPVLAERLSEALEPLTTLSLTRREAQLPALPGKAHAVIGMRRAGKTTFLRQLLTGWWRVFNALVRREGKKYEPDLSAA